MVMATSSFTCNTCSAVFETTEVQRAHMREPWHLYNLRRRMVSLPPVTLLRYDAQVQNDDAAFAELICPTCNKKWASEKLYQRHLGKHTSSENDSASDSDFDVAERSDSDTPDLLSTQCLFCSLATPTIEENVGHMYAKHGLFIPAPEHLTDLTTFLTYLAALVCRYTECLYCGVHKSSRASIQAHMRDKGHCMINAGPDSELFEFWEFPGSDDDADSDASTPKAKQRPPIVKISETELLLPSGAILGARADSAHGRLHPTGVRGDAKRACAKAIEDGTAAPKPATTRTDRRVAVRGEQGLIGMSEQQRRALMVVEKKMMKREAVARSAQRWATEQVANRQKFFKPDVPGRKNG
ncbi:C2H2 type zinc-finger-domain-containing protein [Mycena alexandri]|uniref:C2H2 type zinc-finger-domain-containing protein n=1 Tax=Mycena alexandri TaxID=1745969 RepID=A0AAD6SMR3_9AGAR|nr:C2H2 type zinc-finger-domain-containing protein [Mycena alexandri]